MQYHGMKRKAYEVEHAEKAVNKMVVIELYEGDYSLKFRDKFSLVDCLRKLKGDKYDFFLADDRGKLRPVKDASLPV